MKELDADIYILQLSFSDDIFNCDAILLLHKWSHNPSMKKLSDYFVEQYRLLKCLTGAKRLYIKYEIVLPFIYECIAFSKPSTNNSYSSISVVYHKL